MSREKFLTQRLRERGEDVERLRAEIERLRAALEMIAGIRPCPDNLMGNVDIAKAALEQSTRDQPSSWFCYSCKVEVHRLRCPHCGKMEEDAK